MLRIASWVLISSGVLLLAIWALTRVDSKAESRAAMEQFRNTTNTSTTTTTSHPAASFAVPATADTEDWSDNRVAAYRESLQTHKGEAMAIITMPRLGIEAPIFRGTDDLTLNRGVGWIPGTARPGAEGNSGIAAHRDGFFRDLKDVAVGDVIELRTRDQLQTFEVRDWKIVEPTSVEVLAPTADPTLTLVTCYPFYYIGSAPHRFIVRAVRSDRGKKGTAPHLKLSSR